MKTQFKALVIVRSGFSGEKLKTDKKKANVK